MALLGFVIAGTCAEMTSSCLASEDRSISRTRCSSPLHLGHLGSHLTTHVRQLALECVCVLRRAIAMGGQEPVWTTSARYSWRPLRSLKALQQGLSREHVLVDEQRFDDVAVHMEVPGSLVDLFVSRGLYVHVATYL